MKNKKVLIASGLLLAAGVAGYVAYRKMGTQSSNLILEASTTTGSGTVTSSASNTTTQTVKRVSAWPEGQLLRAGSDDKVYVIDAMGYRHWISNRGYFDSHGYKMANVKSISREQMLAIPELSPLAGLLGFNNMR